MTRAGLLLASLLVFARALMPTPALSSPATLRPLIGAIRWDAWSGGRVTAQVERSLGPRQYHYRLPWFAQVLGPDAVRIAGGTQAVMDAEIDYAARAGIDYWAFDIYAETSDMSRALKLYLQSAQRGRVNFCMILGGSFAAPKKQWPDTVARLVRLMREPGYQTVLQGRPLVYTFHANLPPERLRARLQDLRDAAGKAGLKAPYVVYMGGSPDRDWPTAKAGGCDALSAYARGGDGAYSSLTARVRQDWEAAARHHVPYVPLATTGWDRRPRIDHPVSWERDQKQAPGRPFVRQATPAEIASHIGDALDWTQQHPVDCPAQAIIIYAWNENDEGGWLVPTHNEDGTPNTSRIDALHEMLQRHAADGEAPAGPAPRGLP